MPYQQGIGIIHIDIRGGLETPELDYQSVSQGQVFKLKNVLLEP
jgi:hypothetical protein